MGVLISSFIAKTSLTDKVYLPVSATEQSAQAYWWTKGEKLWDAISNCKIITFSASKEVILVAHKALNKGPISSPLK